MRMSLVVFLLLACGGDPAPGEVAPDAPEVPDVVDTTEDVDVNCTPSIVDGEAVPACGCCPVSAPYFQGGPVGELGCIYWMHAAPPCYDTVVDGCPAVTCLGDSHIETNTPPTFSMIVGCLDCVSGRAYDLTATSEPAMDLTITITSPCGPGHVEDGRWTPAPCDGEATLTAAGCSNGQCGEATTTVRQTLGVGIEQPQEATWHAGSEHVVRAVIAPSLNAAVLPGDISATLEVQRDGAWQSLGAVPLDWQGVARWRMEATEDLALRATFTAVDPSVLPDWLPDAVAYGSARVVPSTALTCTWSEVNLAAAFPARDGAGALTFDGRMWLLGGWNPLLPDYYPEVTSNDVWSSVDGVEWRLDVPNAPSPDMWEARHTAGYAVLGDAMYVLGGDLSHGHMQPDVWRSTDGVAWTRILEDAPWAQRVLHMTAVLKDNLYVFGGQTLPQFGGPTEEVFYNDVWRSADGIQWERILERAPWAERGQIGGQAVLDGYIYLLGGGTYDVPGHPIRKFYNDVWATPDGVNWTRRNAEAPWHPREYHDVASYMGRVFVLEGYSEPVGNRNDVWYSADGVSWYEIRETPWPARHASSVFVHDDALWVVAGNNMTSDVWKLTCSE